MHCVFPIHSGLRTARMKKDKQKKMHMKKSKVGTKRRNLKASMTGLTVPQGSLFPTAADKLPS